MRNQLFVFDLDETLVAHDWSKLTIYIVDKKGERVGSLSYAYYQDNDGQLPILEDGFKYDFSDFDCAHTFRNTARPVLPMITLMNLLESYTDADVVIVTARTDMNDPKVFVDGLMDLGIDARKIHVHRSGNGRRDNPNYSTPRLKRELIEGLIAQHGYTHITMYEDSRANLDEFYLINEKFPTVNLLGYLVDVHSDDKIMRLV